MDRYIYLKRCPDCDDTWAYYRQSKKCVLCGGELVTIERVDRAVKQDHKPDMRRLKSRHSPTPRILGNTEAK